MKLIRSVGLYRASMERYADMLELDFPAGECRVEGCPPPATPITGRRRGTRLDGYLRRWLALPASLVRDRRDIARRFDVVHIVDHTFAHLIRFLPADRTVITCHDLIRLKLAAGELPHPPESKRIGPARFRWSVSHLARAATVICHSEATRSDVIRLAGVAPERIQTIPHFVSELFQPLSESRRVAVRGELGVGQRPLLVHVSSGGFYKNIPGTLHVLADLCRRLEVEPVLVRIGARLDADQAKLARRLGVHRAVRDLGSVPDERLADVYGAADVLVFPSLYEGFGWPVLEAMACGTPVVVSRAPALMELAGDAGLAANADDTRALADAAELALSDPGVASRLRAGAQLRAAQFTRKKTLEAYAGTWRRVAGDGSTVARRR